MALFLPEADDLGADNSVRTGSVFPQGPAVLAKVLADAWGVDLVRADEIAALPAVALITFYATKLHHSPQIKRPVCVNTRAFSEGAVFWTGDRSLIIIAMVSFHISHPLCGILRRDTLSGT
jgi:hypothetical protein